VQQKKSLVGSMMVRFMILNGVVNDSFAQHNLALLLQQSNARQGLYLRKGFVVIESFIDGALDIWHGHFIVVDTKEFQQASMKRRQSTANTTRV